MAESNSEVPMNKPNNLQAPNTKTEIFSQTDILRKMRGELSAIERETDKRGRLLGKKKDTSPESQEKLIEFMTTTIESAISNTTYQRISGLLDTPIQITPGIELGFDTKLFLDMYHLGNDGMPNQLKFTPNNYTKTFSPHYFVDGAQATPSDARETLERATENNSEEKSILPGKGKTLQLLTEIYTKLGIKPTSHQLQEAMGMDGTIFDSGVYQEDQPDQRLFYVMVPDRNGIPLFVTRFIMKDQQEVEEFLRDDLAHARLLATYEREEVDRTNLFYIANRTTQEPTNPAFLETFSSITTTSLSTLHEDIAHAPLARRKMLEATIQDYAFAEQPNTIQYVSKLKDEWRIGYATSILNFRDEGTIA